MSTIEWKLLKVVEGVLDSDMIIARLEDAGIPTLRKGLEVGVWGSGWGGAMPKGISILVPSDRWDEAMESLESLNIDGEDQEAR